MGTSVRIIHLEMDDLANVTYGHIDYQLPEIYVITSNIHYENILHNHKSPISYIYTIS